MELIRSSVGSTEIIKLRGRFDWHAINDFGLGAAQNLNNAAIREIQIDLVEVDYIDSSAIGALLVLLDKSKRASKTLLLNGASGVVRQTLENMSIGQVIPMR
jgi:anti-anti-sigma factor